MTDLTKNSTRGVSGVQPELPREQNNVVVLRSPGLWVRLPVSASSISATGSE